MVFYFLRSPSSYAYTYPSPYALSYAYADSSFNSAILKLV
jgi:hypothetical protein